MMGLVTLIRNILVACISIASILLSTKKLLQLYLDVTLCNEIHYNAFQFYSLCLEKMYNFNVSAMKCVYQQFHRMLYNVPVQSMPRVQDHALHCCLISCTCIF